MKPVTLDTTARLHAAARNAHALNPAPKDARDSLSRWVQGQTSTKGDIVSLPAFLWGQILKSAVYKEIGIDARHAAASLTKLKGACEKGSETTANRDPEVYSLNNQREALMKYLNYPIAGSVLGACTKEKLLEAATEERSKGAGHLAKALIAERVASRLSGRKRVSAVFSDVNELKAIFAEAQNEAQSSLAAEKSLAMAGS